MYPRLASHLRPYCLSPLGSGLIGVYYDTRLKTKLLMNMFLSEAITGYSYGHHCVCLSWVNAGSRSLPVDHVFFLFSATKQFSQFLV